MVCFRSFPTLIQAEWFRVVKAGLYQGSLEFLTAERTFALIDDLTTNNHLMYEIIHLVSPRSAKLENLDCAKSQLQAAIIEQQIQRLCFSGVLRPAGWSRIPSLRDIVHRMRLRPEEFRVSYEKVCHPLARSIRPTQEQIFRRSHVWFDKLENTKEFLHNDIKVNC